jgi:hypothetical protein
MSEMNVLETTEPKADMKEMISALLKANAEFEKVTKSRENPYFKSKYADLAQLIDATKPALTKHGLIVMQSPGTYREGIVTVHTELWHSSGAVRRESMEIPVTKHDAQGVGSAITYGRRYAYQSILNISVENDDDGNAAAQSDEPIVATPKSKSGAVKPMVEVIEPKGVEVKFNKQISFDPAEIEKVDPAYCPHNNVVPAGVSKKTGKPYDAFCKDCKAKV